MKILHLNGYFMENAAYQENLLPVGQAELGHDVYLLTGRYEPVMKVNIETRKHPVGSTRYKGVEIIRVEDYFERKNSGGVVLKNVLPVFKRIKPDIIFFHDISPNLLHGLLYKIMNPKVKFHIDFHSDSNNSRNSLIGPFYHWVFRVFFFFFGGLFERFFCIAPETTDFVKKYYKIPEHKLTFLPLPGDASMLKDYDKIREEVRSGLNLTDQHKIIVHTGKMPQDKETLLVLKAFTAIDLPDLRLIVAGSIDDHFIDTFNEFCSKDKRIINLGWLKPDEIRRVFCASDVLLQPGSLSNTFIDAICCGLPLVLNLTPQGKNLTSFKNGELINEKTIEQVQSTLLKVLDPQNLKTYKEHSREAANYYHYKHNAEISLGIA
jgi:glycosyltransferase involved in cell wall biosynthesis